MGENVRRSRVKAFCHASAASLRTRFESADLLTSARRVFESVRLHARPSGYGGADVTPGRVVRVFCDPDGGGAIVDGMQIVGIVAAEEMDLLKPYTDVAMGVLDAQVDEVSEFDGSFSVALVLTEEDGDEPRP